MKLLAAAAFLVMALSGCFGAFGHCGYQLEAVSWHDARFGTLLQDSVGWNVTVEPPTKGLAHSQEQILSWDATIQSAQFRLDEDQDLYIGRLGEIHLWNVPDPLPDGVARAVEAALLLVTNGTQEEVANWVRALFAEPYYIEDGRGSHHDENAPRSAGYEHQVGRARFQLDGVLEGFVPEEPEYNLVAGNWSVQLEFPVIRAVQGPMEFVASNRGFNEFRSVLWFDSGTNEQAMRDFAAAYESLGVGPVPSDAGAYGSIC